MRRKVLWLVVGVAAVLFISTAFAEFGMDFLDLDLGSHDGNSAGIPFMDVLETPSAKSALAPRTLLNGIAKAGKRLVAVGQRGHILYSDNQGKRWSQADVPVSSDLAAVNFPTAQKGWAVGHDGVILHSSDSGATWVKQFDGRAALQVMGNRYQLGADSGLAADVDGLVKQGPDKPFLDVWFDNETTGYAVGAFNLIFRTNDGGKVWEPWFERTENPKRLHLYSIRRIGQELFIAGEQGLLLKYDPAAGSFRRLNCSYNGTFFGITGKPGVLVAYGLRGNAFRSLNGGTTWQKIESGVPASFTGATVTDDGRIVLVTLLGDILVSGDNGTTFKQIPHDQKLSATAVTESEGAGLALVGTMGFWAQGKI